MKFFGLRNDQYEVRVMRIHAGIDDGDSDVRGLSKGRITPGLEQLNGSMSPLSVQGWVVWIGLFDHLGASIGPFRLWVRIVTSTFPGQCKKAFRTMWAYSTMGSQTSSLIASMAYRGELKRWPEGVIDRRAVAVNQVKAEVAVHLRCHDRRIHVMGGEKLLDIVDMDERRNGYAVDR